MLYFIALLALTLVFARWERDARTMLVRAAIAWAWIGVASLEALGAIQAISLAPVLALWLAVLFALIVLFRPTSSDLSLVYATARTALRDQSVTALMCLAILVATLVTALAAAPNNWDSLTYHLPKVEQWLQNGTLAHFPTSISTQVALNPGAEALILNSRLLFSFGLLDNLVQWTSFIVGISAVSLIAKYIGADARGQALAAVFVATAPMAVLQASSTQNDLTAACWAAVFVERMLSFRTHGSRIRAIEVGMALGLAFVTKGSAMVAVVSFGCWLAVIIWQGGNWRSRFASMALILVPAVLLNVGWMTRNYAVFGHPLGNLVRALSNSSHGPDVLVSNVIRNVVSELATPVDHVNRWVYAGTTNLLRGMGIDPESPASTSGAFSSHLTRYRFGRLNHEDLAANPVQTVVALACVLWMLSLAVRRRAGNAVVLAFGLCAVSGALLFSLTVRWQPWVTRLHLPLYLLVAPAAGLFLATARARLRHVIVGAMFLVALLPALHNKTRPLVPVLTPSYAWSSIWLKTRLEVMLIQEPTSIASYDAATTWIATRQPAELGLLIPAGEAEYPLWHLLHAKGAHPRMHHLQSIALIPPPLGPTNPDIIIATTAIANPARFARSSGCTFEHAATFGKMLLYERTCGP